MKTVTFDETLWRVVPKEPTQEMFNTGFYGHSNKETWERMLTVAPSPPEVEREPVAYLFEDGSAVLVADMVYVAEKSGQTVKPLYLHPTTEEIEALRRDAERWKLVLHLTTHGVRLGDNYSVWNNPAEVTRRIDAAMKEAK